MFTKIVKVNGNDYINTLRVKYKHENTIRPNDTFSVSGKMLNLENGIKKVTYDKKSTIYSGQVHIGKFDDNYILQGEGEIYFNNGFIYKGEVEDGIPHGKGKMIKPISIDSGRFIYFTLIDGVILYKKNPHMVKVKNGIKQIINKIMDFTPFINDIEFLKNDRWVTITDKLVDTVSNPEDNFKIVLATNSPVTMITSNLLDLVQNNQLQFRFKNMPELSIIKTSVIGTETISYKENTKGLLIGFTGLSIV